MPKNSRSLFALVALPAESYTTIVKLLEVHVPVGSDEQENNFSVLDNKKKNHLKDLISPTLHPPKKDDIFGCLG